MLDYVKMAETAKRLIEASGRNVIFRKLGRQINDVSQPWRGAESVRAPASLEVEAKAVFVDPVSASKMGLGIFGEELVAKIEAVALVAVNSAPKDLELCDEVVESGVIFRIFHIEVLKPGPKKLLYIFLLLTSNSTPTVSENSGFSSGFDAGFN